MTEKVKDTKAEKTENPESVENQQVEKKEEKAVNPEQDAAEEIKAISHYISRVNGGNGCVRDVIEQVLRIQGKWMDSTGTRNLSVNDRGNVFWGAFSQYVGRAANGRGLFK